MKTRASKVIVGRRPLLAAGLGTVLLGATPAARAAAKRYTPIFRIERNKNANIVQYDAVSLDATRLDPAAPVVAYWVLHAKDGSRESLGVLDRRAYGFDVRFEGAASCVMVLRALPRRSIRVFSWRDRWVAQTTIAGRNALLERVFVFADESGLLPVVRYVDVFGSDIASGAPLRERLRP